MIIRKHPPLIETSKEELGQAYYARRHTPPETPKEANVKNYQLYISDEDKGNELSQFLRSIIGHAYKPTVHKWLGQMGLSWKIYKDVPPNAHMHLVNALLYGNYIPTLTQIREIILTDKRSGPRNALLKAHTYWWKDSSQLRGLMVQFYKGLSQEEFLKMWKITTRTGYGTSENMVRHCKIEHLPLIATLVQNMPNGFGMKEIYATRLKEG